MRNGVILLLLVCLCATPALAADTQEAEGLLRRTVDEALTILDRSDMDMAAKKRAIVEVVEPVFDFPLISKLVLGRKHWFKLSPEQRRRFESLFVERLKSSYIQKIDLYSGQTLEYRPSLPQEGGKIHIPIVVFHKDQEIVLLYKLYHGPAGWKIYDVEIQGVSIVATFRAQFDQILTHGSVDDLFAELEKEPGD